MKSVIQTQDAPSHALALDIVKGLKAGYAWNNNYPWTTTKSSSGMLAIQSQFAGDRLVFTGGYRRDRVEVNDANGGGERFMPRFDPREELAAAIGYAGIGDLDVGSGVTDDDRLLRLQAATCKVEGDRVFLDIG